MDCNNVEYDRFDGGSFMFWQGFVTTDVGIVQGRRRKSAASKHTNEILDSIIRPFLGAMCDNALQGKIIPDLTLIMWCSTTLHRNL